MARFLNINPTYNPFTLDEMLKFPLLYDSSFREVERKYDELQDKVALLRLYAKDNPEIQNVINAFDENMNSVSDAISSGVWNDNMFSKAKLMKDIYRNNIIPMSVAAQQYENYMQNYLKDIDGTEIGTKPSISWFLEHPGMMPEVVHGSAIQKQLAGLIGNYASTRMIDMSNYNNWKPIFGGQYLAGFVGNGYTDEEISDYFNNPNKPEYATISNIVNNFKSNIGYDKMTPEQQLDADTYINTAIQLGMAGNRKMEKVANKGYRSGSGHSKGYRKQTKEDNELNNAYKQLLNYFNGNSHQEGGFITNLAKRTIGIANQPNKKMHSQNASVLQKELSKEGFVPTGTLIYPTGNKQDSQLIGKKVYSYENSYIPVKEKQVNNNSSNVVNKIVNDLPSYEEFEMLTTFEKEQIINQIKSYINNAVSPASAFRDRVVPLKSDNERPEFEKGVDPEQFYQARDYMAKMKSMFDYINSNKDNPDVQNEMRKELMRMGFGYKKSPLSFIQKELNRSISQYNQMSNYPISSHTENFRPVDPLGLGSLKEKDVYNYDEIYNDYDLVRQHGRIDRLLIADESNNNLTLQKLQGQINDYGYDNNIIKGRNDKKLVVGKDKIKQFEVSTKSIIDNKIGYIDANGNRREFDIKNSSLLSGLTESWKKRLRYKYQIPNNIKDEQMLSLLDNNGLLIDDLRDLVAEIILVTDNSGVPTPTKSESYKIATKQNYVDNTNDDDE